MIMGSENPWDSSRPKFRRRSSPSAGRSSEAAAFPVISSGRLLALSVLNEHDESGLFVQDLLSSAESRHQLPPGERAAAVDIVAGVIRRRRTIDLLLQSQISRPRHQVEAELWRLLQIGVFQLVFGRTPDHAAVDSTVELCRLAGNERWTKFTNGVLRNVGRLLSDDFGSQPQNDALPIGRNEFRRLLKPLFADPETDMAGYVAEAFSLPDSLAQRWVGRMPLDVLLMACFHSVNPPSTSLRVNLLRATREPVAAALEQHGCSVTQGNLPCSLLIEGASRVERLPGFAEGLFSVQDESAMSAALLLAPVRGERVLDLCAAPGGKTCHLAEIAADEATVLACDVSESRLDRIRDNAQRLQLKSVQTFLVDRGGKNLPDGPFDAALVDVPCSNTGVLNRRPEARWRFRDSELQDLIPLQTRLLLDACERIVAGGRVVYSTCSLEPEENRGVVDVVLRALPAFRLDREQRHNPGSPADGAYQALLIRSC